MKRRELLEVAAGGLFVPFLATLAYGQLVDKLADDLKNGEYNWFPDRSKAGPVLIIVSIPDQRLHVYRNGIRVAASSCSTGKPGHATPTGVFKILQKDKFHRSSTYSNAPMPNMNRLTWSGIALHAGNLPGYPASHGCVRLPMGFSELLFDITRKGMTVVIADNRSESPAVVHPGLVLSRATRSQFDDVAERVGSTGHSDDIEHELTHTTIVVSGRDRKATLYENHHKVLESPIEIEKPDQPLAEAAYHLHAIDKGKQEMHWQVVHAGKGDRQQVASDLHRIQAPQDFSREVHGRAHKGMVLVTTADSHTAANTVSGDFVVIDGIY